MWALEVYPWVVESLLGPSPQAIALAVHHAVNSSLFYLLLAMMLCLTVEPRAEAWISEAVSPNKPPFLRSVKSLSPWHKSNWQLTPALPNFFTVTKSMQSMVHVRLHQDINLLLLGFLVYKPYRKKRPISVHSLRNLLLFINNDVTEH